MRQKSARPIAFLKKSAREKSARPQNTKKNYGGNPFRNEAPLAHITPDVKRLMAGEDLHTVLLNLSERVEDLDGRG